MRIIGGHDYFDSALAYGRDENLVFSRARFEDAAVLPYEKASLQPLLQDTLSFVGQGRRAWNGESTFETRSAFYRFVPAALWFAGKRYGAVKVDTMPPDRHYGLPQSTEWFWEHGRFDEFLRSIGASLRRGDEWSEPYSIVSSNIEAHFSREPTAVETDWLVENRVSIAVWTHSTSARGTKYWRESSGWKIDVDGLGKMGFAKRLDPFAAFQELSMWIGGVLPRQGNPMVEITDEKTMVAKHGMDEWSFRRPPKP